MARTQDGGVTSLEVLVEDVGDASAGHFLPAVVWEQGTGPDGWPGATGALGVTLDQSDCRKHQGDDSGLVGFASDTFASCYLSTRRLYTKRVDSSKMPA